jgi:ABC-2 type transport system ATP-binding protein/lipopolysaccharide transport system ATP-binding protein
MAAAIRVEDVSKRYYLGGALGGYTTLRDVLSSRFNRLLGRTVQREEIWALRNVSFELDEGETLGIVGHNGAGKTTLLKILARITHPTSGVSRTRGRVGSLLDVGTGFHPELNGRENIYLSGSILGMKRREIDRRFDEIVEFSGLERFLDTPLKRFSWGMWLRLAFGVAAHVDPDVMLVDEVLAVGDVRFREKCLGKMSEFGREGRTVVFVSHDLGSIGQLCRRALWFEHGGIRADGPSAEIIERYVRSALGRTSVSTFASDPTKSVQLLSLAVVDDGGEVIDAPRRDEPLVLRLRFLLREPAPGLSLAVFLQNHAGVQLLDEDWGADTGGVLAPEQFPQEYEARLTVPAVLPAGEYVAGCWLGSLYDTVIYEPKALGFRLWPRPDQRADSTTRSRLVQPGVEWDVQPVVATGSGARLQRDQ